MTAARRCDRCRRVQDDAPSLPQNWLATVLQSRSLPARQVELCAVCSDNLSAVLYRWFYQSEAVAGAATKETP